MTKIARFPIVMTTAPIATNRLLSTIRIPATKSSPIVRNPRSGGVAPVGRE